MRVAVNEGLECVVCLDKFMQIVNFFNSDCFCYSWLMRRNRGFPPFRDALLVLNYMHVCIIVYISESGHTKFLYNRLASISNYNCVVLYLCFSLRVLEI